MKNSRTSPKLRDGARRSVWRWLEHMVGRETCHRRGVRGSSLTARASELASACCRISRVGAANYQPITAFQPAEALLNFTSRALRRLQLAISGGRSSRFAKEAAMKAASLSQRDVGRKDLKSNFMSLSMRRHRSGSDADDQSCLSLSSRGGVGDCVRNAGRSTDPLSQSFRHNRPAGLY